MQQPYRGHEDHCTGGRQVGQRGLTDKGRGARHAKVPREPKPRVHNGVHKEAIAVSNIKAILNDLATRNSGEPEFLQAVSEVLTSLEPVV